MRHVRSERRARKRREYFAIGLASQPGKSGNANGACKPYCKYKALALYSSADGRTMGADAMAERRANVAGTMHARSNKAFSMMVS